MSGPDGSRFTLTAEEYEDLALTMADTTRWVVEARQQIDYYRRELVN